MRYLTAVTLLSFLAAFASATVEERDAPLSPLSDRATALVKCPDGNGCKCHKDVKQGQVSTSNRRWNLAISWSKLLI